MKTRHNRAAAILVTLSTVVATMFGSVGASASTVRPHARHRVHAHHHRHVRHHPRRELYGISPAMMTAAARVSRCEEGGNWHFSGTYFDGGIGWTPANWLHFRKPQWPRFMHDAPPHMQANALYRFVRYYGIGLPDQNGVCAGY